MLVTCATFNYLDMLTLLLASHAVSNPEIPLHVHAIDWPNDALINARAQYPFAVFHAHADISQSEPEELRGPVPRTAGILKLKVDIIHQAFQQSDEAVLWVDADTLLLSSVHPLIERVKREGDFGVTYRRKKRDHAKFAVAVLCFVQSDASAKLLESYVQGVRDTQGLIKRRDTSGVAWFHDQLGLWQAYRKLSRGVLGISRRGAPKLVALNDQEHSIDGNTDAVFVSRRDQIFDTEHMQAELARLGVEIRPIALPTSDRQSVR